MTMLDGSLFDG